MKIYLGADHGGYRLKEDIKLYLEELGMEVVDKGTEEPEPTDDYPDFVAPVARAVSLDPVLSRGVVFGRSGQGEAMIANRYPNVRATTYYGYDLNIIKKSREDNDANVLSLGADHLTKEEAKEAVRLFLDTPFSTDAKYQRRVDKAEVQSTDLSKST
ncbi:MAG: ribose-5-phosphate isomerase [Candidatus Vogelbacteria bacterium CG10_big_fil_rev_8_21_14_0_10_45_14]|uniref:Ribose-5-phosphate isomerase n=1 Tax=Candidatus Vogelbacteria bacterium CG10_big_fil_rev_8_21_14_0_10_45_14 TaxID=1975042 RepID=A0A2H0RIL8_9BACT|nr:MAG: ribose-5-phosphate isomerase [Candidatus Vogelbacteria bacterium CG10_big_fil_rev_8_21_14_0_10_45_14]